jgi:hypothetical protein
MVTAVKSAAISAECNNTIAATARRPCMPFSIPLAAKKKVRTGSPVLATPPTHIDP